MATATVLLNKKYQSKDKTYPIVIRLNSGEKQKIHSVGEKIAEAFWTGEGVSRKHPEAARINSVIDAELSKAKLYFADCRLKGIPVDLDLVFSSHQSHSFTGYLQHRAAQHKKADQIEMHFKVARFAKELIACFGREVFFHEVTQDALRVYENWLKEQGNGPNTRHKKFEFLGKYYGNAVTEKKAQEPNPFKHYKIKTVPVKKEKLSQKQIKAIEDLELEGGHQRLARDLFLFSYYCKGLRFENVITMPKSALQNGRLYYTINKSNRPMSTMVHPKLQAIIERYIDNPTDTIFGRLNEPHTFTKTKRRSKVGSENAAANRALKTVGLLAELPIPLTMHIARHAFAFGLKQATGNVAAVQDSLGQSRSQVTEAYLKALDDELLDAEVSKLYR